MLCYSLRIYAYHVPDSRGMLTPLEALGGIFARVAEDSLTARMEAEIWREIVHLAVYYQPQVIDRIMFRDLFSGKEALFGRDVRNGGRFSIKPASIVYVQGRACQQQQHRYRQKGAHGDYIN